MLPTPTGPAKKPDDAVVGQRLGVFNAGVLTAAN
jgi:hypothetical protein